jgi:DNA replication protein DnaC
MGQQQALDLMAIIEDRHGKRAAIIVSSCLSQLGTDIIPYSIIVDAILDRLVHTSIRIELKEDSL